MSRFANILPPLICVATTLGFAADPAPTPWPLWDGSETIEHYAQRVNLPPKKTLDLGNGVKLELVLIPAGEFIMGRPEPRPYNPSEFSQRIVNSQLLCGGGAFALLVAVLYVGGNAIIHRRRPQFSLLGLLAVVLAGAVTVLGGVRWYQAREDQRLDRERYERESLRFGQAPDSEKPAHRVTLTAPFYMGKHDVTQEQYQQVIGANPSGFKGKDNPVETVSWDDAQAFCKTLTERTTQAVRLPTEAEWEYACRAGTTTTYHSGDTGSDLARAAWYSANSKGTTHPVGQKEANAFGLYDMHGNVWQWCQDWYGEDYYRKSGAENPQGPARGTDRVLRGVSWDFFPGDCGSAFRIMFLPGFRRNYVGFRVVAVVPTTL